MSNETNGIPMRFIDVDRIISDKEAPVITRELARRVKSGGGPLEGLISSLSLSDLSAVIEVARGISHYTPQDMQLGIVSEEEATRAIFDVVQLVDVLRLYEGLPIRVSEQNSPLLEYNYDARVIDLIFTTVHSSRKAKVLEVDLSGITIDESILDTPIEDRVLISKFVRRVLDSCPDNLKKLPQEVMVSLRDSLRERRLTLRGLRDDLNNPSSDLVKGFEEQRMSAEKKGAYTHPTIDGSVSLLRSGDVSILKSGDVTETPSPDQPAADNPKAGKKVDPLLDVLRKMGR